MLVHHVSKMMWKNSHHFSIHRGRKADYTRLYFLILFFLGGGVSTLGATLLVMLLRKSHHDSSSLQKNFIAIIQLFFLRYLCLDQTALHFMQVILLKYCSFLTFPDL